MLINPGLSRLLAQRAGLGRTVAQFASKTAAIRASGELRGPRQNGVRGFSSATSFSSSAASLLHRLDPATVSAPNPSALELKEANEIIDAQIDRPEVIRKAIATIKAAAARGSAQARARVGRWYLLGICGCKKDVRAGIQLLYSAAKANDVEGQFWLGKFFSGAETFTAGQQDDAAVAAAAAGAPGSSGETDPAKRAELAKAVIAEIRAMRKVAKENKVRRVQGLPPLPLKPEAAAAASSSSKDAYSVVAAAGHAEDDGYATVPLLTNTALAHRWLLAAASQDHADSQVALGNLMMATGEQKQAIWWYEVAAQVSHHSLPGTLSTPPAGGVLSASGVGDDALVAAAPPSSASPSSASSSAAAAGASPAAGIAAPGSSDDAALIVPAAPNASGALPHADALYNLGLAYWEGIPAVVPRDRLRAAAYFRRAADLFDPSALFWLGYSHHNGDKEAGIPRDSRFAMRYLELAAGSGHPGAAHYLARLYRNGDRKKLGLEPNARKADFFLRAAADSGHAEAIFELADAYFHGQEGEGNTGSVEKDYPRALELYEKAASLGHVRAMVSAGAMYYHGLGVPGGKRDFARAHQLYTDAGERGSAQGWENVAAMYALGEGVPRNESAAVYIRTRVIPQMLEQQAAKGGQEDESGGAILPEEEGDDDDGDDMPSGGGGGGCGKPSCKSGGCGSKKKAAEAEADAKGTCKSQGGTGCGGSGNCKSKQQEAGDDHGHDHGHDHDHKHKDGSQSDDFAIKGTLYRASDPAPAPPTTKQGGGDSPDDPIVLDLTNAEGVIASLTSKATTGGR